MSDLRKPVPPVSAVPRTSLSSNLPPRDSAAREFSFSTADFERVRKLIYQHAGISLSPVKQDMVYSRLARRLRATGKSSFADYLDALEKNGGDEWERFVNSLTTNLTSFFANLTISRFLPSTCASWEPGAPSGSGVRRRRPAKSPIRSPSR